MWAGLIAQGGAFQRQEIAGTDRFQGHIRVYVSWVFEKATVHYQIPINADNQIVGLHPVTEGMLPRTGR